jgi:hypothetical protein
VDSSSASANHGIVYGDRRRLSAFPTRWSSATFHRLAVACAVLTLLVSGALAPQHAVSATVNKAKSSRVRITGRLGTVVYPGAKIYDGPMAKVLYATPAVGVTVVITGFNSQYFGVLMADGREGYVRREYIQLMAYDVALDGIRPKETTAPTVPQFSTVPLIETAFEYMGIPYRWGGTSRSGIDCSGFVQSVFKRHGMTLPRVARDQAKVGYKVPGVPESLDNLQPGDRLYFQATHNYIDHTGIYIGRGYFIHSSGGRGVGVDYLPLSTTYRSSLVVARRS